MVLWITGAVWSKHNALPASLVGGLEHDFYDFPYTGNDIYNPNWRTPSFFRGVAQPPTRSPAPNNAFPFVILSSGLWGSIAAHVGDHGLYMSMIAFIPMLLNIAQHLCLMNCIQGFLASIPFALNRNYLFLLLTPSFNSIFYLFKHITIFSLLIHPHVFTISHVRLMDWWLNILYHDSYHTHFWWIVENLLSWFTSQLWHTMTDGFFLVTPHIIFFHDPYLNSNIISYHIINDISIIYDQSLYYHSLI